MREPLSRLVREYARALGDYLRGNGESALSKAYELGRGALADGAGVLDIIGAHRDAVAGLMDKEAYLSVAPDSLRSLHVLTECLSPFEMVMRGFSEANLRLRQSLDELCKAQTELRLQHAELAVAHAQAETERRRYLQLFEFAPNGYLVTDPAGVILEVNSAASALLGVPRERLAGCSLLEFVASGARDNFREQLNAFERGESDRRVEWEVPLQLNGQSLILASLTVRAEFDSLRWLIHDATERRRAENERTQSLLGRAEAEGARRLAFLADASAVLAGSLDDETKLARVAELAVPWLADWCIVHLIRRDGTLIQLEVACGHPGCEEVSDKVRSRLLEVVPGSGPPPFWQASESTMVLETPPDGWVEPPLGGAEFLDLARLTGMRSAIVVPLAIRDLRLGAITLISAHEGHSYSPAEVGLAEDLGRRCALAAENNRLYYEVIRERDIAARANRAKEEFLAVLSHEMRNPLMPVVGWTRILGSRTSIQNDPMLIEGVRAIERNVRTLNRLVGDCLDLARISEGKIHLERSVVDLNQILLATAESARERAESRRLSLALHICREPLWVFGDTVRIEQVVVNLLVNAVKYTSPGGTVSLDSTLQDGEVEIAVSDTGIGIESTLLEQIFQPFHQGTGFSLTSSSGLGLGLAIARQIVELHGGRIWAESDGPGAGSVFRVRLPLTQAPEVTEPAGEQPHARSVGPAIRVLLVEDAADVLFLLRAELEQLGYSILEAHDGQEALDIISRERPAVIVSDIKMPVMDGYEMIRRLRAMPDLSGIPAIALTGFGRKGDIEKALSLGFNACLTKPTEPSELAECIRKVTRDSESADLARGSQHQCTEHGKERS